MGKKQFWTVAAAGGILLGTGVLFLSAQKKSAAQQFEKALKVADQGNLAEAAGLLEKTNIKLLKSQQRGEAQAMLERARTAEENKARATALLEEARGQEKREDVRAARESYKKLMEQYPGSSTLADGIKGFGQANIQLLFSKEETPYSAIHVVKSGESLAAIAKKYNMTVELLAESNGITGSAIRKKDRLKVCTAKFSILIDKSQNTLTLKANEELFKIYSVGTGKEGSTPIGEFQVTHKLTEPTWYHPQGGVIPYGDKANLLGSRWIGINSPGYGIHGTWEPDSVGKQSSAGCIRLLNSQVEELYKIITEGTSVTIVD